MKKTFKLLTSITTLATLSSIATVITSCSSNTREVVISLAYQDLLDMSFSYNNDGDGIITITCKDVNNYVPEIKLVQIGEKALEKKTDYEYDNGSNTLTIFKKALDANAGKIYVFPSEVTFRPVSYSYKDNKYQPTIAQKTGIECNANEFNDTYLADAYNNYQVFEQDWFSNQNYRLSYWDSIEKYESTILYLNVNKNVGSDESVTYTLDVLLHNDIKGKSNVEELGTTAGQWWFYGNNITLLSSRTGINNWTIVPNSPDSGKWSMHMYVTGFDRTDDEYEYIDNDSDLDDINMFIIKYFSVDKTSQAIGLNSITSYYFDKVDTVTITSNVTKTAETGYSLSAPDTVTNKDTSFECKIAPDDKEALYAPKLTIKSTDGQTLYSWACEKPIKGDFTYIFDLRNKRISQDVKVEFITNAFAPVDYSSLEAIAPDWSKTDICPDYIVIDKNILAARFKLKCADTLKDNLYKIDWQINDQDDNPVYKPADKPLKEPNKTESSALSVSYGLDPQKVKDYSQFKLVINSIDLTPHVKVTYLPLPQGWEWDTSCKSYVYENPTGFWKLERFKLYVDDDGFYELYNVNITVKQDGKVISTHTLLKPLESYGTHNTNITNPWVEKDIEISVDIEKIVTYDVTRDKLPRGWHYTNAIPSRIYNKDGKWVLSNQLTLYKTKQWEEKTYTIKYTITDANEIVLAEKTIETEIPMVATTITGDWVGTEGPGPLHVGVEITEKDI